MKPENQFIKSVHVHLDKLVYRMKNNNPYIAGIPDCWYSAKPYDLWAEYKYLPIENPRTTVVPGLSKQQLNWIINRQKEGRTTWTIIGCKPGGVVITDVDEMITGISPEQFMQRLKSRKDIAQRIFNHCTGADINATT